MCINGLFPWVKRPGNEADRSYTTNAKIQMNGVIPPLQHTPLWHEQGPYYLCSCKALTSWMAGDRRSCSALLYVSQTEESAEGRVLISF